MMTCRNVVRLFCDLVGSSLPVKTREMLERHLDVCPNCRAYLESYRLTIHLGRRLHCPPLPERLSQRLAALLSDRGNEENAESF